MNVHVQMTPTQAKLYQERKAREARIKAAAIRANDRQVEAKSEAAWSDLRSHVLAIKAKAEREAQEAKERADKAEREIAKRKAQWRASWRYMIRFAAEIDRQKAREMRFAERQELHKEVPPPDITFAEILEQTAAKYAHLGVTVMHIKSNRRTRGAITQARFEVCWRAREETGLSLPHIGKMLGDRDHTTILHAVRMYEKFRQQIKGGAKAYTPTAEARLFGVIIPDLVITE